MTTDDIAVIVADGAWASALPEAEALATGAVRAALAAVADRPDRPVEVSVVLDGDRAVRALNRDYRGKDAATNVLSFPALGPGDPEPPAGEPWPLGDVILAFGITEAEALAEGKPLAAHFVHLVVHGMLHLLGFDHGDDAEAEEMEGAEVRVLATLGIADPYAEKER